ncbi:MAG: DNA gyrase inhibitor YacG [Burkholderiaceae bacterium]|nr:DNA gyrase inhibitor YacG [Burkholderiaceae bacterium]
MTDNAAPSTTAAASIRQVVCPTCAGPSLYSPENRYRPFCSKRCKKIDLGAWASEEFAVPTQAPPDDAPYGDPRLQN